MYGDRSQFTLIAKYYDALMAGVPYRQWVAYIEGILDRINYRPTTVLDLACGTGNVSELLAHRGYKVVGVDISPEMIEVAKSKGSKVEYIVQDITELDLGRNFDLAVCLFDSLNYITEPTKVAQAFKKVGKHLVPGGVLIFDVNTVYALQHKFFDQANLNPAANPRYVWTSEYDHQTRLCRIDMLFEVDDEQGEPHQFKEVHYQRGHTIEELTQWLIDAGFEIVDIFHAYRFRKPTRRSDRVFFVARKPVN
ncbi:MAG: methyltransferase domain-containing protein [Armatimonadota bacterium]|nr:methyltransferase domain-containing protein [Armatimonadota bacterium]